MLYNESKHNILALVGKANKTLEMRISFFEESAKIERTMLMNSYLYTWTCISLWIQVFLVMLLIPVNIFYKSSRYFFLRCFRRIIFAPFYKVHQAHRERERVRDEPATHSDHAQTNGFQSASHAVDVVEENLSFFAFLYDWHVRRTIESSDFCDMILCIPGGAFWFLPRWSTN